MTAEIAAFLNTPFDTCRKTPITLFWRMHSEAARLSKRMHR